MSTTRDDRNHRDGLRHGALVTMRYIVGGLVLGVGVGAGVEFLLRPVSRVLGVVLAAILALAIIFLAARGWARRMASIAGRELDGSGRLAALSVAVPMIGVGGLLSAIEPAAVQRGASMGFPLYVVYATLFVLATLIVVAVAAYALGQSLGSLRLGAQLAMRAAPVAALAFLAVVLIMFALGWRVGAPGAARRATMVTVTALAALGAALAAGATLGHSLAAERSSRREDALHAA